MKFDKQYLPFPYKIAITGGIASGKSTFSKIVEQYGYDVYYADKIAHNVLQKKEVIEKLVKQFGKEILQNNEIDRKKLGSIVFNDREKLQFLNSIVHPEVIIEQDKILSEKRKLVFVEIPLLFESNQEKKFDLNITISVKEEIQLKRIVQRDGRSNLEAINILKNQMKDDERNNRADIILENNSSLKEFEKKAKVLLDFITHLFTKTVLTK